MKQDQVIFLHERRKDEWIPLMQYWNFITQFILCLILLFILNIKGHLIFQASLPLISIYPEANSFCFLLLLQDYFTMHFANFSQLQVRGGSASSDSEEESALSWVGFTNIDINTIQYLETAPKANSTFSLMKLTLSCRWVDISTWTPPPQDCLYLGPSSSVLDNSFLLNLYNPATTF